MKKVTGIFLFIVLILTLNGCSGGGSDTKASDKALSVGKQALKTVDDYLDGALTYDKANKKFEKYCSDMSYADLSDKEDENRIGDFVVKIAILGISTDLTYDNFKGDSDSYDDLVGSRNELAEAIGEKNR